MPFYLELQKRKKNVAGEEKKEGGREGERVPPQPSQNLSETCNQKHFSALQSKRELLEGPRSEQGSVESEWKSPVSQVPKTVYNPTFSSALLDYSSFSHYLKPG